MKHVIVASTNPVKTNAVQRALDAVFGPGTHQAEGHSISSGVSDQPMTDGETLEGARNRASAAMASHPGAGLWVGIEGGVEDADEVMRAFAWAVVLGRSLKGEARTGTFQLPPEVTRLLRRGVELGDADDIVFGRTNSKQKDGAVGILTDGLIDRTGYYEHAVVLALIPFLKKDLYGK